MNHRPRDRLERLLRHARDGFDRTQTSDAFREQVATWLETHPSPRPDVDAAWHECLRGHGPLFDWLEARADPNQWSGPIPLRVLLASHPFRSLPQWSARTTSDAS